jgi:hypothetical protein
MLSLSLAPALGRRHIDKNFTWEVVESNLKMHQLIRYPDAEEEVHSRHRTGVYHKQRSLKPEV